MCGICGIFSRSGAVPDAARLVRMRDRMIERGPDAAGLYQAPGIGLGTRRLRILDLSPAGEQPLSNEDGTVQVAFNGAIYNFPALRAALESEGHVFRGRSDTEVLAHGWEAWGEALPAKLSGMFAFAVWDAAAPCASLPPEGGRGTLFLARDRLGKKPLFIAEAGDEVLFASSLPALLAGLPSLPPLDARGLDAYLMFGAIPAPGTIFEGIRRLRAGEQARFTPEAAAVTRYWQLSFREPLEVSAREAETRVETALKEAIHRRLAADVPLGALLSGGLDSSVIVALMREVSERPVAAFTISACDGDRDDAALARAVAKALGVRHTVLPMPPDSGLSHWVELVWQYGQPFGDPSALPTYTVAKLAREQVTVVLTGDGGDEAFGGYARHTWKNRLARWQQTSPAFLRRALAGVGQRRLAARPYDALGAALVDQDRPLAERLVRPNGWIRQRPVLYRDAFAARLAGAHPDDFFRAWLSEADGPTELSRTLYADYQFWLPEIMLTKVDTATMAASLEARCPLVDADLVALVARLPDRLKAGGRLPPKYLLRRLAEKVLPPEIARQGKVGFRSRQARTLRDYPGFVRRLLSPAKLAERGFLRPETVTPVVDEYLARGRHSRRVWLLLWLELWLQMFRDGTLARETPFEELVRG